MEVVSVGEEALPVALVEELPVLGGLAVEVLCKFVLQAYYGDDEGLPFEQTL